MISCYVALEHCQFIKWQCGSLHSVDSGKWDAELLRLSLWGSHHHQLLSWQPNREDLEAVVNAGSAERWGRSGRVTKHTWQHFGREPFHSTLIVQCECKQENVILEATETPFPSTHSASMSLNLTLIVFIEMAPKNEKGVVPQRPRISIASCDQ